MAFLLFRKDYHSCVGTAEAVEILYVTGPVGRRAGCSNEESSQDMVFGDSRICKW